MMLSRNLMSDLILHRKLRARVIVSCVHRCMHNFYNIIVRYLFYIYNICIKDTSPQTPLLIYIHLCTQETQHRGVRFIWKK